MPRRCGDLYLATNPQQNHRTLRASKRSGKIVKLEPNLAKFKTSATFRLVVIQLFSGLICNRKSIFFNLKNII